MMSGGIIYGETETFEHLTKDWVDCVKRANEKGIDFHRSELNQVEFKGGTRHGFVKSMIAKALDDNGYRFLTEAEMRNGREADIYVASTDTVIEIETGCGPADKESKLSHFGDQVNELFIIDPLEWPTDFKECYDKACREFIHD